MPRKDAGLLRAASPLCDRNHGAHAARGLFVGLVLCVERPLPPHLALLADLLFAGLVVGACLRRIRHRCSSSIAVHIHNRIACYSGI